MIKITKEMLNAGSAEFHKYINTDHYDPVYSVDEIVAFIYQAMCSAQDAAQHLSGQIVIEHGHR